MPERDSNPRESYNLTVYFTCAFAVLFAVAITWLCIAGQSPSQLILNALSAILGSLIGWALGMYAVPYDAVDKSRLTSIGKTVSAFFTGYAFSKVDRFLELSLFEKNGSGMEILVSDGTWFRIGIFFCSLLLAFLTIFSNRAYFDIKSKSRVEAFSSTPRLRRQRLRGGRAVSKGER
ncbi:hypothetical protein G3N59_34385 [Paraburkholderia sp. Ac-20340]|uniref:hypothetical protein n=1 Tax=Paraburkholderia sp. Ac-20340 TaxID=2703888 RepID=UPI00198085B0|nr:hypothetical protein [Paraburkholderia sp. Ac-20340]MBN3858489.1 hypothetical protein [Paraburkholderia sp. Ac-20340]